jgi:hypothetical protein
MAALLCEESGREMAVEFRIPRLGAPGLGHEFHSCDCGFVTSQKHADSHALQMAEREVGRMTRLANQVTAPPVPPKLLG